MQCSYTHPPFRAALAGRTLRTMLEIGSLHGLDALEVLKTYRLDRVITIECNPECIEICRKNFAAHPNVTLVPVAAWHEDGTIPFYRVTESVDWNGKPTHNIGASSCFETNGTWPFEKYTQERIEVPARRLDGVLDGLGAPVIDLICMDAQGAELYALQGLGKYLDGVQAIITELEIKPMYHGQTLFDDVCRFLQRHGFRLAAQNRWAKTAGDFLFLREGVPAGSEPDTSAAGPARFTPEDLARACSVAQRQAARGRAAAAQTILDAVLGQDAHCFPAHVLRGHLAERARDFAGAVASYERAIAINPGHALPFTRRALIKLRLALGDPPRARARDAAQPFVMMASLGANGRFGNQLLQYGLLHLYAAKAGAQVLAPDWIGRDLFGLADPTIGDATPVANLDEAAVLAALAGGGAAAANVNLGGYFCGDTSVWAAGRAGFARCFRPVGKVKAAAEAALRRLVPDGRRLVALHVRRGDYGTGRFWLAPSAWYRDWLARHRAEMGDAVVYLASDDPAVAAEFAEWPVVTAAQLGAPIPGAEFFLDHWVLRHADWLATSNSTFSVTAALLNEQGARCYRPDRATNGLRAFDPWAEPVLLA
ncbi:MAG: FkbM family methyltransferase [Verrucomicrobiota bacterium]